MKVLLHIGHSRTGTTTLQALLAANRERLRTLGVDYPAVGTLSPPKGIAQHKLAFSLLAQWPQFAINAKTSREECWSELTEYLKSIDNTTNTIFLSSEAFSSLGRSSIQFIREYFQDFDVTTIFVRRDSEDWRRSWREHNIIRGQHIPVPTDSAPDVSSPIIEKWSDFFDIRVIDYGPGCLNEILRYASIELGNLAQVPKHNEQPPKAVIELLNELNAIKMKEENRLAFNKIILDSFKKS